MKKLSSITLADITLAWYIARRELKHSIKAMWLLVLCLVFGVFAISAVGSFSQSLQQSLLDNAALLLGGDASLRSNNQPLDDRTQQWLGEYSDRISNILTLRAMLQNDDENKRKLVELKAVDDMYPLYGALVIKDKNNNQIPIERAIGDNNIVVAPSLLTHLKRDIGDEVKLGDALFTIAGVIKNEPDVSTRAIDFGPRVIIHHTQLPQTNLLREGSLVKYFYRLDLRDDISVDQFEAIYKEKIDDRSVRFYSSKNPANNIRNFIERTQLFLNLIGLMALLIGGIGVRNTINAYIRKKRYDFAILKSISAPLSVSYLSIAMQIMLIGGLGVLIAVALGSLTPWILQHSFSAYLPVALKTDIFPMAIITAFAFGYLVMLLYMISPIAHIRAISVRTLFRGDMFTSMQHKSWGIWASEIIIGMLIVVLTIIVSGQIRLAFYFMGAVVGTIALFYGTSLLLIFITSRIKIHKSFLLHIALNNLNRPNSDTANLLLSFGLGLTILVGVNSTQYNLQSFLARDDIADMPGFYFIDIQNDQIAAFRDYAQNHPHVSDINSVPMLRGFITQMNGVDTRDIAPHPRYGWVLRGDRGITWARTIPENSEITRGQWWAEDYDGEQLVSLTEDVANAYNLDVGDSMSVNILGREIKAKIANLRDVNWNSFNINFVMVFSPGILSNAPQSHIATVILDDIAEDEFESAVISQYPNISAIRVKDLVNEAAKIIGTLALSIQLIAVICLLAAFSVLAGTMIADYQRRMSESVIFKMLGAHSKMMMAMMLSEYALLALIAAFLAFFVGNAASFGFISYFLTAGWALFINQSLLVLLPGVIVILLCAYFSARHLLTSKPIAILRND